MARRQCKKLVTHRGIKNRGCVHNEPVLYILTFNFLLIGDKNTVQFYGEMVWKIGFTVFQPQCQQKEAFRTFFKGIWLAQYNGCFQLAGLWFPVR